MFNAFELMILLGNEIMINKLLDVLLKFEMKIHYCNIKSNINYNSSLTEITQTKLLNYFVKKNKNEYFCEECCDYDII